MNVVSETSRLAYFELVKIGRLAIRSSCALGCFFFGFFFSRPFASLFPMTPVCHGDVALAKRIPDLVCATLAFCAHVDALPAAGVTSEVVASLPGNWFCGRSA